MIFEKPLFVTGIGTDVGKTIVSAILVEKYQADYWKPVQAGDLDNTDTMKVQRLISNSVSKFHPEAYRLTQPYSPHKAAALDGIEIDPSTIQRPKTSNRLIIEGAGGLMVPLNNNFLMVDLIQQIDAEVVVVSRNYLGSINHTLLTLEVLKQKKIKVKALIFNGKRDEYSENLIKHVHNSLKVNSILPLLNIDRNTVLSQTSQIEL